MKPKPSKDTSRSAAKKENERILYWLHNYHPQILLFTDNFTGSGKTISALNYSKLLPK